MEIRPVGAELVPCRQMKPDATKLVDAFRDLTLIVLMWRIG